MCRKGLVSCLFKVCELFFQGRKVGAFNDLGMACGSYPHHEVEWGFASSGVWAVIVNEFCHGNMIYPCFRVKTTEDVEVGFNFLIESLHFSISLRAVDREILYLRM